MTIHEACQLVIQAGAVGKDGEALVLDMGEPVRIDDVARRLASQVEQHVSITYAGPRPAAKLHKALLGKDEPEVRPVHPLISHAPVPGLEPKTVLGLDLGLDGRSPEQESERIVELLRGRTGPATAPPP